MPLQCVQYMIAYRWGEVVAKPHFHTPTCIYPPGLIASWKDEKKRVTILSSISSCTVPREGQSEERSAMAGTSPQTTGTHWRAASDASPMSGASTPQKSGAAARAAEVQHSPAAGTPATSAACEKPVFTVTAVRGDAGVPADTDSLSTSAQVLVSTFEGPDAAWQEVVALQAVAQSLPSQSGAEAGSAEKLGTTGAQKAGSAAAAVGEQGDADAERKAVLRSRPELLAMLQEVELPAMHWGRHLFGLTDVPLLQMLEGQDAVEQCSDYTYVEVRPSWPDSRLVESSVPHLRYCSWTVLSCALSRGSLIGFTPSLAVVVPCSF